MSNLETDDLVEEIRVNVDEDFAIECCDRLQRLVQRGDPTTTYGEVKINRRTAMELLDQLRTLVQWQAGITDVTIGHNEPRALPLKPESRLRSRFYSALEFVFGPVVGFVMFPVAAVVFVLAFGYLLVLYVRRALLLLLNRGAPVSGRHLRSYESLNKAIREFWESPL